jgi:hypothetical protein
MMTHVKKIPFLPSNLSARFATFSPVSSALSSARACGIRLLHFAIFNLHLISPYKFLVTRPLLHCQIR